MTHSTSHRIRNAALAALAAGSILTASVASGAFAQTAQTAQTEVAQTAAPEAQSLTVSQTEGPYFKVNSPERTSLLDEGMQGTVLTITGQVLSADGTPVANALLDFWQADASGNYDNSGYTLRGHQYTDENGYYALTTVVPGLYPGRTRHIHVKVQAPNGPVLTSQLYFLDEARNANDGIFNSSLVLPIVQNEDGTDSAVFNFVINTA
jgi:protocatechuate 3,4-dioxygenase beta subunit